MNITRAALLCLLAALAACDDAPCSTDADCFSGEVCREDGKCRQASAADLGADLGSPREDMTTPPDMLDRPDMPEPDLPDPACAGLMCGPGTCERANGVAFCLCPTGYRTEPLRCSPIPTAVAAGALHTCAIAAEALYCWGSNSNGQLGTGDDLARPTPAPVSGMGSGVTAVALGDDHTCAIKDDALFCWGSNGSGKIGAGSASPSTYSTPQRITADTTTTAVSVGGEHTCATINDVLHCWGGNLFGQLGQGDMGVSSVLAPASVAPNRSAQQIDAGVSHTCAVNAGMLSCWGAGAAGRLGNNNTTDQGTPQEVLADVTAVGAGEQHTCAISDNALLCWGGNTEDQLGVPSAGSTTPTRILADGVTYLAVGGAHSCAVHRGVLKCWGNNRSRQAAPAATDTTIAAPTTVAAFPDNTAPRDVAAGVNHTCAISGGTLYCWGDNSTSQLGSGAPSPYKDTPTAVTFP